MSRPLNPFEPSRPIDPANFVGRIPEIEELEAALQHAKMGKPRHFLLTGDRGVGKTSFMDYIRRRATSGGASCEFNFIVVDFAINKNTTKLDLARALKADLEEELSGYEPFRDMLNKAWSFIQRIEAAGVSVRESPHGAENHREMYVDMANSLSEVSARVCGQEEDGFISGSGFDGILILVDEVDQASSDLDLGSLLKYLLERLNRIGCDRVVIGLAGLPSSIDVLVDSHPSSLRIFDELRLDNLRENEVNELLDEVELLEVDGDFGVIAFTDEAKNLIVELSNGHPHFVHQLGYCAFENCCKEDTKGFMVEKSNVLNGAFEKRGAIELIGDVYFKKPFSEVSSDGACISVLNFLSESPRIAASLSDIVEASGISIDIVEYSLKMLSGTGLVSSPDEEGKFSLRHPCFGYWFKARRPEHAE